MKKTLLSLIFSFFSFWAVACSCYPFYSFCEYKNILNPDLILSAEIIDTNQHGIRLKKIDLIEGTELRDTIPVWNDTDFFCTGTITMRATQIGEVGDTVIVMLPRIDSVYTPWGVIGDYRTPMHLCGHAFIKIKNDTLNHAPHYYLEGNPPSIVTVERPSYQDFITYLGQYSDCEDLRKGDFAYKPFPESIGTFWTDEELARGMGYDRLTQSKIDKDTMIGGVNYQKIIQTIKYTYYNPNPVITYSTSLLGYLRNDSANRKVWLRLPNQSSDTLLYDFNMSMGYPIHESFLVDTAQANFIVDSIRFQRYADGVLRKHYYFNGGSVCGPYLFIEGIGLSSGAFLKGTGCVLAASSQLNCLNENNQIVYPDSTYSCDLITGINENSTLIQDQTIVFPNPIHETFQIDSPIAFESIHLYNNKGQLIKSLSPKKKYWSLDVTSGMYFLRFETEEGQLFHKKIMKH